MRATPARDEDGAQRRSDRATDELLLGDRYLCGPVIARGAVGEVRYGEDIREGCPVAVKVLDAGAARHPEHRRRFDLESTTVAALHHPNVVRVLDAGEEAGRPYLVMECLPGATFADELTWGPTDEVRAWQVGLDVLSALDAAHAQGIIHRDIKPSNLLVSASPHGDLDGPVKVADFGIAVSLDAEAATAASERGQVIGTPAYLSPERLVGTPATYASDLWSLGVVLYEALAGVKPFVAANPMALAWTIHRNEHVPLGQRRPELHPALVAVVERALATDVEARFVSAAAMRWEVAAARPAAAAQPIVDLAVPVHPSHEDLGPTAALAPLVVGVGQAADGPGDREATARGEARRRRRWLRGWDSNPEPND